MAHEWDIIESWREIFEDLTDSEIIDLIIYENERFQRQKQEENRPRARIQIEEAYYEPNYRKERVEEDERGIAHISYKV